MCRSTSLLFLVRGRPGRPETGPALDGAEHFDKGQTVHVQVTALEETAQASPWT